jgi:hypothetical protein
VILSLLVFNQSTVAGNPYAPNIREQQQLSREAWQHYWNSLTPREKYLVQSIDQVENDYYNNYGTHIPINQTTLSELMRIVGAQQGEQQLVLERMQAYIQADEAIENSIDLERRIMNDPIIWGR